MSTKLRHLLIVTVSSLIFLSCGQENQNEGTGEPSLENQSSLNQRVPVEVMVVVKRRIEQRLELTSKTEPIHAVDLLAEVSGKITQINKKLGDYVSTTDTLAYIDDRITYANYRQAKSKLVSAKNNLSIAKSTLASDEILFKIGDISQLAYDNSVLNLRNAEAGLLSAKAAFEIAEKAFYDTRIVSPINGIISRKFIDEGIMMNMYSPAYRVVDIGHLKLNIGAPQSVISRIKINNVAFVSFPALKGKTYTGYVKYISPQADERTGSFDVEIQIKNSSDLEIKAGITANVALIVTDDEEAVIIPDYAIVEKDNNSYVYLIRNMTAVLVKVDIREIIGSTAVVESGISPGDTLVSVGMKNLGINTRVWIESVN